MTVDLDKFEQILQDGLLKVCRACSLLEADLLGSPDIDGKWDEFIEPYVGDAVVNFNGYPNAALGFAAYLGMGVAHRWDEDWLEYRDCKYQSFYGPHGFDDMDDNIVENILHLDPLVTEKVKSCFLSLVEATLGLISHEGIRTETEDGFYVLSRAYSVFYRIGASVELRRLGYKMSRCN